MTDGVTAAFEAAVDQYIGNPKLYGFYVADQPTTVPAANIKAEADYIHANLPGAITFMWIQNTSTPTSPVYNLYNPQNTDIDLFGISPQPVRPQFSGGMDLSVIPDPRRLVFIDETWTKTNMTRLRGWAPRGERLVDKVPQGQWKTATFLAACETTASTRPACSTGPSTASASTPMSNSSSCLR